MAEMTTTHRHGDARVLAFFDEFEATPLADRELFARTPDDETIVTGAPGTDTLGAHIPFITAHDSVTVAVIPSDDEHPLCVLVLSKADACDPDSMCDVHAGTSFDMILTGEEFACETYRWTDGTCFDVEVVWPLGWNDDGDLSRIEIDGDDMARITGPAPQHDNDFELSPGLEHEIARRATDGRTTFDVWQEKDC